MFNWYDLISRVSLLSAFDMFASKNAVYNSHYSRVQDLGLTMGHTAVVSCRPVFVCFCCGNAAFVRPRWLLSHCSVVVVVQSLSHVQLFVTPWTAARQASLSFTVFRSLLKLKSIESVMPSNHLILCRPLLPSIFPSIRVFPNELAFASGGQSTGASASTSVFTVSI